MKITFLGTGAAEGVPAPACHCPNCKQAKFKPPHQRNNTSLLIQSSQTNLLIDAGDAIMAKNSIIHYLPIDSILLTHLHADHILGLFLLRWSQQEKPINVYYPQSAEKNKTLIFQALEDDPMKLNLIPLDIFQPLQINDFAIQALPLNHVIPTQGYFLQKNNKKIAHLVDTKEIPTQTREYLDQKEPLNFISLDATFAPKNTQEYHNSVQEAIEILATMKADNKFLTHIGHHNLTSSEILLLIKKKTSWPHQIQISYDNLEVKL